MKLLIVNTLLGTGSTGKIVGSIAKAHADMGWDVRVGQGCYAPVPQWCAAWDVPIGSSWEVHLHQFFTRIFDWHGTGLCSYFATRRFLKWAGGFDPDVLWLHNIHGYYLNYEMLFKWIKSRPQMQVKWTLHDCWAFTGHCSHFQAARCDRWQMGCYDCPEKKEYPKSWLFSAAKSNWFKKRMAFTGVKNLSLIAPSQWLADLTRQCFLCEYPIEVVRNAIDCSIFKPTPSDFKKRYDLEGKIIVLGVASQWDVRKGLADFYRLRELLDAHYAIVLVGLTAKQVARLPAGILGITRTSNVMELVKIYSASDWFFNPTREDNYPTVNLEAVACGCRVVTYDTGGSKETVEGVANAVVLSGENKSPEGFVKVIGK